MIVATTGKRISPSFLSPRLFSIDSCCCSIDATLCSLEDREAAFQCDMRNEVGLWNQTIPMMSVMIYAFQSRQAQYYNVVVSINWHWCRSCTSRKKNMSSPERRISIGKMERGTVRNLNQNVTHLACTFPGSCVNEPFNETFRTILTYEKIVLDFECQAHTTRWIKMRNDRTYRTRQKTKKLPQ